MLGLEKDEYKKVVIDGVAYMVGWNGYVYNREPDGDVGDNFIGIYDEKTKTIKKVKQPKDAFSFLQEKKEGLESVMKRERQEKGKKKLPPWFKPGGGKAKE